MATRQPCKGDGHFCTMQMRDYPVASLGIALLLIFLSPFVSLALNYLAFGLCVYRVIRYDESLFAVDYCILSGVSYIFLTTGRVSLFAWLSIVAALWYIVRDGLKVNVSLVLLIAIFDYLLLRMGSAPNSLVLCFSQLLMLYVLLSRQRRESVVPCALAFCGSVVASSAYALAFRGSWQLRSLLGNEGAAFWGSSLTRFQGLFRDPNYYMTMLTIAIVLLAVLWINGHLSGGKLVMGACPLVVFGALTYSKTFLVVLALFVMFFIGMLVHGRRYALALGVTLLIVVALGALSQTVFSVTLYRITSADNLYDLTTGRSELLVEYLGEIGTSADVLLFGRGLSAEILRRGTHNLFLEIAYFLGVTGLLLMVAYAASLLRMVRERFGRERRNPSGIFRYVALVTFVLLFCTLQGMTFPITYTMLYLSLLATEIRPRADAAGCFERGRT